LCKFYIYSYTYTTHTLTKRIQRREKSKQAFYMGQEKFFIEQYGGDIGHVRQNNERK
jgi:hypothetical protein